MKYLKLILLIGIALSISSCSKQMIIKMKAETPQFDFQDSTYYKDLNIYQQDLLYTIAALKLKHPDIYYYFPKDSFEVEKKRVIDRLAKVDNSGDFQIISQQFIAKIGDGHTQILPFDLYDSDNLYPFKSRWIGNHLYIYNVEEDQDISMIGSEIVAIEGMRMSEIEKRTISYLSGENLVHKRKELARKYINNPIFLQKSGVVDQLDSIKITFFKDGKEIDRILYSMDDPDWLEGYKVDHPITVKRRTPFYFTTDSVKNYTYLQFNMFMDFEVLKSWISDAPFFLKPIIYPVIYSNRYYHQITNDWYFPFWGEILREMFDDMERKGVENLIIDLRHNGGGNSTMGKQLIYFLDIDKKLNDFSTYRWWDYKKRNTTAKDSFPFFVTIEDENSIFYLEKPDKRFRGKIYILTGQDTFSSAVDFTTLMQDNGLATIVGEPTGGRPSSFGDLVMVKTPNTESILSHSWKFFQRPDHSKERELFIIPDIEIYPTIDDLIEGRDPQFEWILDEIVKKRSSSKVLTVKY